MVKVKIYGVYDGNEMVFKGTRKEISREFGLNLNAMCSYTTGRCRLKGLYSVEEIGEEYRSIEHTGRNYHLQQGKKAEEKQMDYRTDPLRCLEWHLKTYGNTLIPFDPTSYLEDLKSKGINARVTLKPETIERKRVTRRGRKPKQTYNYLVEVV